MFDNDNKNKEEIFKERLNEYVYSFGEGSQEGVKSALRECQDIFSMVSSSKQEEIATAFKLDFNIIKNIIRFMPSIKEVNVDYEITCCTGSRCAKNGSIDLIKGVREYCNLDFGETSSDGKFSLSSQNCFKKCSLGPNIKINDKFYHQMNIEKFKNIMDDLEKK